MPLYSATYPQPSDLTTLLNSLNLGIDSTNLDLATAVDSARQEFEGDCGRVMIATTQTRYYDPPTNLKGVLILDNDLLTIASLVYNGTTLVQNTDYWIAPYNSGVDSSPIKRIEFNLRWQTLSPPLKRSIVITGTWGYASQCPILAWKAILYRAAWILRSQIALQIGGGTVERMAGDERQKYQSGSGASAISSAADDWAKVYDEAVEKYSRREAGL